MNTLQGGEDGALLFDLEQDEKCKGLVAVKNIFVVTHTEATHHLENKVGGWYDSDLTYRGSREADTVAEHLAALICPGEVPTCDVRLRLRLQSPDVWGGKRRRLQPCEKSTTGPQVANPKNGLIPLIPQRRMVIGWIMIAALQAPRRGATLQIECFLLSMRLWDVLVRRRSS